MKGWNLLLELGKRKKKTVSLFICNFFQFFWSPSKSGSGIWNLIWIHQKAWIRSQLLGIRNTAYCNAKNNKFKDKKHSGRFLLDKKLGQTGKKREQSKNIFLTVHGRHVHVQIWSEVQCRGMGSSREDSFAS